MSEDDKQGFWSNWPAVAGGIAALVAAVGSLIAGLAAAGVIGGGNGGNSETAITQQTASTSSTTVPLPFDATEDEQRLGAIIPLLIRATCDRGEPLSGADTLANLSCRGPDMEAVVYNLFESATTLSAYMDTRLPLGDRAKKCGNGPSGSSTYRDNDKDTIGRLVCYVRKGTAWIEWSNLEANVYAYASRNDGDWQALFNSWTEAGPDVE